MLAAWLLTAATTAPADGGRIAGVVIDPQRRPIAGAVVHVQCASSSAESHTNDGGEFSFQLDDRSVSTCEVRVSREGFESWTGHPGTHPDRLSAQLTIAKVREEVTVKGRRPPGAPLASTTVDEIDLRALGPDLGATIAFAKRRAGIFVGNEQIFVDGLPAGSTPDAASVQRLVVNGNPFSAEFAGVNSIRIDLESRAPARQWRFNVTPPAPSRSVRDPLTSERSPQPAFRSGWVSAPVPFLPLVVNAQASSYSDHTRPAYVSSGPDGPALTAATDVGTMSRAWSLGGVWTAGSALVRGTIRDTHMRIDAAGVGGLTTPSAGSVVVSDSRQIDASWRRMGRTIQRGGIVFRRNSLDASANSTAAGLVATGQLTSGGAEIRAETNRQASWYIKHVVESQRWLAGAEFENRPAFVEREPNPHGILHVERVDDEDGVAIVQQGTASARVASATGASFIEYQALLRPRMAARLHLRADWQHSYGVLASPRISSVFALGRFDVGADAGLFVDTLSTALLTEAAVRGNPRSTVLVVANARRDSPFDMATADRLTLRVAPGFTRRRDAVARVSLERSFAAWSAGVEQRWTAGLDLAGLVRTRSGAVLTDVLNADRRLRRSQTHVRAGVDRGSVSLTAHYELIVSRDDTDGPLSLPARADDIAAEWAPSSGIGRHNASMAMSMILPGSVQVFATAMAASGVPYSVVTGRDAEGLATFTDRDGAPRNDARLPASRTASLQASRRFRVPGTHGVSIDAGVRVENLLNSITITSVGTVAGTAWFGRPLAVSGSRAIAVWMTMAR